MINEIVNYVYDFMNEPGVSLWFSLSGLFSTFFGIWSHYYSNKKKELSWTTSSYCVIRERLSCLDDIEILLNGEEMTALTVTKIALWNSGNKHIDLSDIMLSCPLHICTTDGSRILTSKIISVLNSLAVFEVDPNHATDFSIPISFEVIDPKQGTVIQILHTGNADSLVVDGKIKGGQCRQIKQNKYYLVMKTTGMTTLPYFLGPLLLLSLPIIHATNSANIAILFIFLLSLCTATWCTVLFFECWYSMRVPRKLKAYFKH